MCFILFHKVMKPAIQPTRAENYPEWYQQVVSQAELAEVAPVRGCMVIKPWGYALWEHMQKILDENIKASGHQNIYCPLFIPLSFLEKEAEHVAGFAKECAVVTHSKLVQNAEGKLEPASPLDAPLVVRPTSETMIGDLFSKWIQSHRDLPLKINQWANIVRWEMRTRLFLRTTEFLWQEGHTAHQSAEEANQHALKMLGMYEDFAKNKLAICSVSGEKSENERFPGAVNTYTFEAMMQDKKALQVGTSHYLGQTFAKSSNICYQDAQGKMQHVYTTSWGVTTRMIGALIMSHSDDNGLVLPPALAPHQIVILPILSKKNDNKPLLDFCTSLAKKLQQQQFQECPLRVHIDDRERSGGEKNWSWVKKGVPIRLEIGQREFASGNVSVSLRTQDYGIRENVPIADFITNAAGTLADIQQHLLASSTKSLIDNTVFCATPEEVAKTFKANKMVCLYWHEHSETEDFLASEYQASIRCLVGKDSPFPWDLQGSSCYHPDTQGRLALVAKAY